VDRTSALQRCKTAPKLDQKRQDIHLLTVPGSI